MYINIGSRQLRNNGQNPFRIDLKWEAPFHCQIRVKSVLNFKGRLATSYVTFSQLASSLAQWRTCMFHMLCLPKMFHYMRLMQRNCYIIKSALSDINIIWYYINNKNGTFTKTTVKVHGKGPNRYEKPEWFWITFTHPMKNKMAVIRCNFWIKIHLTAHKCYLPGSCALS